MMKEMKEIKEYIENQRKKFESAITEQRFKRRQRRIVPFLTAFKSWRQFYFYACAAQSKLLKEFCLQC